MWRFMSLRGPPQVDRGNLNRYILDCFVVKLLAMTAQTQLIHRERLQKRLEIGHFSTDTPIVFILIKARKKMLCTLEIQRGP